MIDSDTLVLVTPNQVDKMNLAFIQLDEQIDFNLSYMAEIALLNEKIIILEDKNKTCEEKAGILVKISKENHNQVDILTSDNKKKEKKIKLLKKMRTLFGIGGVVIGGVGGYLLSQILK